MKKGLIIASVASVMAISAGCAFAISANRGIRFEAVKAADKTFTFDESVGAAQFDNKFEVGYPANISVSTGGISDNLETTSSLPKDSTYDYSVVYGDSTYHCFVRNGETYSSSTFDINIGVNNPTEVSVTYCLIKDTVTLASEVGCRISVFDDVTELDTTYSSGDSCLNHEWTYTWTRKDTQLVDGDRVRIEVEAKGGSVYWGEPLYIKSIELHWSC